MGPLERLPLRFYSRYRESFLRFYIFMAKWTRVPLIGGLVRVIANLYGKKGSQGGLLSLEEAEAIVDCSEGLAVGPCTCRQVFRNCNNPLDVEIMLGLTRNIFLEQRPQDYKEITKEKAKKILRDCHQQGLIQSIIKCRKDFYAICNCCSCCCVPLRLKKEYGIGQALLTCPPNIGPG